MLASPSKGQQRFVWTRPWSLGSDLSLFEELGFCTAGLWHAASFSLFCFLFKHVPFPPLLSLVHPSLRGPVNTELVNDFFFFRATPAAYGGSQARGSNWSCSCRLCHNHSNMASKLHLWPVNDFKLLRWDLHPQGFAFSWLKWRFEDVEFHPQRKGGKAAYLKSGCYPLLTYFYRQCFLQIRGHIGPLQIAWLYLTSWGYWLSQSVSPQVFELNCGTFLLTILCWACNSTFSGLVTYQGSWPSLITSNW